MTTTLATTNNHDMSMEAMENVLVNGDLSRLSPADRLAYYRNVCTSIGLNPLTKPFDYLKLSGRLTLYARKDATDQLRRIHGISIISTDAERVDDVYVVTAVARTAEGRTDTDIGAVPLANLKGEALANAMMKAHTKAKRRVTLSISGLGMLDESEVESIPQQQRQFVEVDHETGEIIDAAPAQPQKLPAKFVLRLEELATNAGLEFAQMDADAQERYERPGYAYLTTDEATDYAAWLKALAEEQAETAEVAV